MNSTLSSFISSAQLTKIQLYNLKNYIRDLALDAEQITVEGLLSMNEDEDKDEILGAAKEILKEYFKSLEPFRLKDMKKWLYNGGHDTGDDFLSRDVFSDLCIYKQSHSNFPDVMKQRDFHKVLVVSGESGAGKSFSSVRLFPQLLVKGEQYEKLLVFYCCRSPEEKDLPEEKTARDNKAYNQLQFWWGACWKKVFDDYPQLEKGDCKRAAVVMVVDELGNRPHLLRGLLSIAATFGKMCTMNDDETSSSVSYHNTAKVGQFRLICVGTGLDWSVHHLDEELASDPSKYHHISIQPWSLANFQSYVARSLHSIMPEKHRQEVITELMTLQLSRIGSNPRCAEYLMEALNKNSRIESSFSPATTLFNHRAEIFRNVASQYRNANGIAKLFSLHKDAASELLSSALRLVYSQDLHGDNLEKAKQLLIYGVLSYDEKLYISPAMLLMLLSEFGYRDMTVLDGEDFEQLTALRELGHILMEEARAKVFIIVLKEPIPSTRANEMKNGKFSFQLPRRFFHPATQGSTSVEQIHKDAYYIIVNGPRAPSADVIVLPPEAQKQRRARFIQAKKYIKGYNPSLKAFKKELANLGLDEQAQRATYCLHQALANGRQMEFEFVLSCGDVNGGVSQALHDKIESIKNNSGADLKAEVVHPLWQSIMIDGDVPCDNHKYTVQIHEDKQSYSITSTRICKQGTVENDDDLGDLNAQLEDTKL
eukprot:gene8200-9047_t